jgi:hypothetical protein
MFLAVVTGSFLFLVPWIGYLSASLPDHHEVTQWRLAWVGFDAALIVLIGVTALCAWRRLQIFIPWAMITATLLCCDAWFDIVLDWNTGELAGAVLTAVLAELPLALLLFYAARKMIRLTVLLAWERAGRDGPVPPLSRLSLIVLSSEPERDEEWRRGPGNDRTYERDGRGGRYDAPSGPEGPAFRPDRDGRTGRGSYGGQGAHDAHGTHDAGGLPGRGRDGGRR